MWLHLHLLELLLLLLLHSLLVELIQALTIRRLSRGKSGELRLKRLQAVTLGRVVGSRRWSLWRWQQCRT